MNRPQAQTSFVFRRWGGPRAGAGRKPTALRAGIPHRRRVVLEPRHPSHVTLRAVDGLPSLRGARLFPVVRAALAAASTKSFRVVHFSVQVNHIHLLAEPESTRALACGMQGLGIRVAKAINRQALRRGRVWADRYHSRGLRTPREVRNALVYVLLNGRKHGVIGTGIDPCSSGAWFTGWREAIPAARGARPVVRPQTWLLSVGWRRGNPIGMHESPVQRRRHGRHRREEAP